MKDLDDLVSVLWLVDSDYFETHGEDRIYTHLHEAVNKLEEYVDDNDLWEEKLSK